MQDCRLVATDIACRRGDRLLFRGLSLSLQPGEALQVLGANGIGKSSLIRILAGLLRPFAGNVQRAGRIGLVDDRSALDPQLPLGRALAFWAALDSQQRPDERLGLARLLDVPVRYLSTGQKKRAALARLMGQRAEHWLLDEPLNGLDTDGVALTEQLIAEQRSAGGTIIIASHQPLCVPDATRLDLRDYRAG